MTASMPDLAAMQQHAVEATALLKALAHPSRLMVMCWLVEQEASVGALQELVGLSMSALSQHLAVLREVELVTTRKEAQTVFYSVKPGPALEIMRTLHGVYCGGDH